MAKFYGAVGFVSDSEVSPGIWEETVVEHNYTGDVIKNSRQWMTSEGVNDNLITSNSISIIADSYAWNNLFAIRYVKWMGKAWKITSVDAEPPRLTLNIGEIFNGNQAGTSNDT